jgi:hypothetical protein
MVMVCQIMPHAQFFMEAGTHFGDTTVYISNHFPHVQVS